MNSLLMLSLALLSVQSWKGFEYMGVHGGEFVVRDHTAILAQCNEEQGQVLVTVHVPHGDEGRAVLRNRTLYVQLDGGETRSIEKTEDRPFPAVFQFEAEE